MADRMKRGVPSKTALPLCLVLLWCALPSVFLYSNNAYEVPFGDVLLPLAASVLLGALCFAILRWILKSHDLAALMSVVFMGLFLNFNFVVLLTDALFASVRVRVYYFVAGALGLLLAAGLFALRKQTVVLEALVRLSLVALGVVLLINVVTAAPKAAKRIGATSFSASGGAQIERKRPNLYYIIVDEYASFDEIEKYYGYDNSSFHKYLTDASFCVSDSSYNRVPNTVRSIADNVNLGPAVQPEMDYAECENLIRNGTLYGVLEGMGYDLYQLGTLYPLPLLMEKSNFLLNSNAVTMNGETATEILMKNSMLMPLPTILYWRRIGNRAETELLDWLIDPANYNDKGNRAIFAYVCSPHPPFYYDANGNLVDEENWTNWTDKRYYLDQYIHITHYLEKTLTAILHHDPDSVVIVQSDHGLRYHNDSSKPHTFHIDFDDQRQILNAVYFRGERLDIIGLSGYNTWRAVLSALGENYPVLPES